MDDDSTPDTSTPEGLDAVADDIFESASPAPDTEEGAAPLEGAEGAKPAPATPPAAAEPTAPSVPGAPECPSSLTGKIREQWATLAPDVQGEFIKREQDFYNYYEQTREPIEITKGVEQIFTPYRQLFENYGVNPFDHVQSLLAAHTTLLFGKPEQRHHLALALLADAGIDPASLANGQAAPVDERWDELRRQNAQLSAQLQKVSGSVVETQIAKLEGEVVQFAEQKNADGSLKYPHFWDVSNELQELFRAYPGLTLQAAYNEAILRNPVVRSKEVERMAQERAEQLRKEAATRTRSARRATAVNVQGTATGRHTSDSGDWEKDLGNMLQEIQSR